MKGVNVRKRELKSGTTYEYYFEIAKVAGKRKFISKGGFEKAKEAEKAGYEALKEYETTGKVNKPSEMSYSDFIDAWLASLDDLKLVTISNYEKKIRLYIRPVLGSLKLKNIENEDLQSLIDTLFNRGLSINTLSSIIGILTKSFRWAVVKKYVPYSPVVDVHIPKNKLPTGNDGKSNEAPHVVIAKSDVASIIERFPAGTPSYIPLLLGYKCGLRLGEAFGLCWDDIDFDAKEISIKRQVQWHQDKSRTTEEKKTKNGSSDSGSGYWYFSQPKYKSYRVIDILNDELLNALKEEKQRQEKAKDYYAEHYTHYYLGKDSFANPTISTDKAETELNLVCIRENGTYCSPRIMQHTSTVINKNLNIKFDYHSLRHTHATELVDSGAKPEYVQHRLGHKKIEITMNVYYHLTDETRKKQSHQLSQMF